MAEHARAFLGGQPAPEPPMAVLLGAIDKGCSESLIEATTALVSSIAMVIVRWSA